MSSATSPNPRPARRGRPPKATRSPAESPPAAGPGNGTPRRDVAGKATREAEAVAPPAPDPATHAREAARLLKLIANPTRVRVLIILAARERNVTQMSDEIVVSQPVLSHHLAMLRASRLIEPRRAGKNIYYSSTPAGRNLAEAALRVEA